MKLTRRAIAQMLAAGAAGSAASAVSTAQTVSDPVKAARDQFQKNTEEMALVKIPMATEPPFHFRPE